MWEIKNKRISVHIYIYTHRHPGVDRIWTFQKTQVNFLRTPLDFLVQDDNIYIYIYKYRHKQAISHSKNHTCVARKPNRFQILSGCSSCLKKLALVLLPPIHRTQPGTCVPGISPPCLVMKNGGGGQIQSAWWKSSAKFSSFRSCLAKMLRTNMEIWATVLCRKSIQNDRVSVSVHFGK